MINRRRSWAFLVLGVALAAIFVVLAVAPGSFVLAQDSDTDDSTQSAIPNQPVFDVRAVAAPLINEAVGLQFGASDLTVLGVTQVNWPDTCLGLAVSGMPPFEPDLCEQSVVPGYRVVVSGLDGTYVIHTNRDGSEARLLPPTISSGAGAQAGGVPVTGGEAQQATATVGGDQTATLAATGTPAAAGDQTGTPAATAAATTEPAATAAATTQPAATAAATTEPAATAAATTQPAATSTPAAGAAGDQTASPAVTGTPAAADQTGTPAVTGTPAAGAQTATPAAGAEATPQVPVTGDQPVVPSIGVERGPAQPSFNVVAAVIPVLNDMTGLNFSANDIRVISASQVTFPDDCLGLAVHGLPPFEADVCGAEATPGYRIGLVALDSFYVVHTNLDGSEIRVVPPTITAGTSVGGVPVTGEEGQPSAAQFSSMLNLFRPEPIPAQPSWNVLGEVIRFLGDELDLQLNREVVTITSVQQVNWQDACLGLAGIGGGGTSCAPVSTPGYRIVANVVDGPYVIHTNADGSDMRLVPPGLTSGGGAPAEPTPASQ
ncbi:MAG TPA: hypothetical protein VFF68_10350 [Anaerolineaceae bacterium]|nr:hypothetical protein [Anaerolineaceae bacterium]